MKKLVLTIAILQCCLYTSAQVSTSSSGRVNEVDNAPNRPYSGGYFFRVHNESINHKYIDAMVLSDEGDVGIGTTSPGAKLAVNGDIHTKEIKVDLVGWWPDYVFENSYQLPTLEQVENHIHTNGHLN